MRNRLRSLVRCLAVCKRRIRGSFLLIENARKPQRWATDCRISLPCPARVVWLSNRALVNLGAVVL